MTAQLREEAKVTIIAAVGEPALRTRLAKVVPLYEAAGYVVEFWGWDRGDDGTRLQSKNDVKSRILLRGGGYANRGALLRYPLWMLMVLLAVLRWRPDRIHALGIECALPAVAATYWSKKRQVIFDDADRLSLTFNFPVLVRRTLQWLERLVARRAHVHIIPGVARYPDGLPCARTVLLANTPSSSTVTAARSVTRPKQRSDILTLYANGWIGDPRGAELLDALCQVLDGDPSFELLAAGRLTGSTAHQLVRRPNVRYLGVVSPEAALAAYAYADIAITLYDPRVPINRYAEANKWGDCMVMGLPFIVNEEVETAHSYVCSGQAFAVPYDNAAPLVELIRKLQREPMYLQSARKALGNADTPLPFDHAFTRHVLPHLKET